MPVVIRARARYVALAAATIVVGLAVHLRGSGLSPVVRDMLGDALWAAMVTWLVSALAPSVRLPWRAAAALAYSFAIEFSQLIRQPALDALRATLPGHLLLGSGFDPRDLIAYSAGVLAVVVIELIRVRGRG